MAKVYVASILISILLSLFFVPLSIFLSKQFDVYDIPDKRKVHTRPIPRWGGLGIFLTFVITLIIIRYISPQFRNLLIGKLSYTSKFIGNLSLETQIAGLLTGMTFVLILGMIDDKRGVRALTKFLVQIISAYCAMDFGIRISGIVLPTTLKYYQFPILLSQGITVLWIIGFMNTINLADGLDGLAAGIVTIASGTFFIVSILQMKQTNDPIILSQLQLSAILSLILCGTTLGFLLFNFNPAKVFMGDSGALTLGFLLASISIIGTLKTTAVMSLFIPIIIIALPVIDVVFSIYRRLRKGMSIGEPDKKHIHHRLLKFGWTQREVVLFLYIVTLILSIIAITITALSKR